MPSFDIVCEIDHQEVNNAVDQANREIGTRFDFKGVDAKFEYKDSTILLRAEVDFQLNQMLDILRNKLVKRDIDVGHMQVEEPNIQLSKATQEVQMVEGISKEKAKKITQFIKQAKLKVQPSIQGDQIRVSGKKRDDLQDVIQVLKQEDFGLPLTFNNFRD